MENVLGIFPHDYQSSLPAREMKGAFPVLHCDNQVGFLDLSPSKFGELLRWQPPRVFHSHAGQDSGCSSLSTFLFHCPHLFMTPVAFAPVKQISVRILYICLCLWIWGWWFASSSLKRSRKIAGFDFVPIFL